MTAIEKLAVWRAGFSAGESFVGALHALGMQHVEHVAVELSFFLGVALVVGEQRFAQPLLVRFVSRIFGQIITLDERSRFGLGGALSF